MTLNMGLTDRRVRIVAAVVLLLVALFAVEGTLAWLAGGVAVILAATSTVGTCPLYLPFGFSTRRT